MFTFALVGVTSTAYGTIRVVMSNVSAKSARQVSTKYVK